VTYLSEHFPRVADLALAHLILVGTALGIALAIATPLGILAARRPRLDAPLLGTLGVLYTIPSLALLALLVRALGLGFWTAAIALVIYAQFVLVRNIAAGLRGVDAAQVDAARGLGMSDRQILVRVQFPQALPVIIGGMRIASVSMIAIATLAAYVGSQNLGTLIFEGLAFGQDARVLAGSLAAMLLAILVDTGFRAAERIARRPLTA
jgi:osmoprotectant transport system permease protein